MRVARSCDLLRNQDLTSWPAPLFPQDPAPRASLELKQGDIVIDLGGPMGSDRQLKTCSYCAQVAYRVFEVTSADQSQRDFGLCGAHFNEARTRYSDFPRNVSQGPYPRDSAQENQVPYQTRPGRPHLVDIHCQEDSAPQKVSA